MIALELVDVSKRLGGRAVLEHVSLTFEGPGVVFVRGENGAGKSTLLRIVSGLLHPDTGDLRIAGASILRDRVRALSSLGYAPDAPELPERLTVCELFALVASLRRASKEPSRELAAALDVGPIWDRRLGVLSLGQKRRALLLVALGFDAPLVALDEPTNGLDASGLETLARLISERTSRGLSTLLASHDASFAARVATVSFALAGGRLVREPP